MATCPCDYADEPGADPCSEHKPDEYQEWLAAQAPRLAAAKAAGDPFLDQKYLPEDATKIPEFRAFRAALSDVGRARFDEEWELTVAYDHFPNAWEMALAIRDSPTEMIAPRERNALRRQVANLCLDEGYPISGHGVDCYEFSTRVATPKELLTEADRLAEVASHMRRVEEMLREHAAVAPPPAAS